MTPSPHETTCFLFGLSATAPEGPENSRRAQIRFHVVEPKFSTGGDMDTSAVRREGQRLVHPSTLRQAGQLFLFFGGRCEEALEFYRKVLGARVEMFMHHRDSPDPHPPGMLQPGFENKVMHATIRIGTATLMASDGCDDQSRFAGFRLSLALATEDEAKRDFAGLSDGGSAIHDRRAWRSARSR